MDEVASRLGIEKLSADEEAALLEREGVSSVEEIPADADVALGSWDDELGGPERARGRTSFYGR